MAIDIDSIRQEALARVAACSSNQDLETTRVDFLGRKGKVTELLKSIKDLPKSERPTAGGEINRLKQTVETLISEKREEINEKARNSNLSERIDITLPGRKQHAAGLHPINTTLTRIEQIFVAAGYRVASGPEIEDDYHNFKALNIPDDHPARDMHDTFYLSNGMLLRTHTSPVQIRVLETTEPPLRIICPGRVYRRDFDRTHTPMFHQVEGLVVDRDVSFADMKGTVLGFLNEYFERDVEVRFRPSYFPFTEPSAEVDIMGKSGWTEIMGCGMVHPNVLSGLGIDTQEFTGFAFGFGADRMAMLKHGLTDLRTLFENDIRFLSQAIQ